MGMGRKTDREKQQGLWVAASEMVTTPGHVFYERLNVVLNAEKFDPRVEAICRKYYKSSSGRPSLTPGTYFRMLLLGYFEGIDSGRGIAWRAADSLSYRKFLGYDLSEQTPEHTTVSRTRRLYSVETHSAVMQWVLKILRKHGLADGQSVCIDGTTLAANAAMKSLVRRTFCYCMAALPAARSLPRPFAPVATVCGAMLLALVCVGWLLFFIHHITHAISVSHIVDRIASETTPVQIRFVRL